MSDRACDRVCVCVCVCVCVSDRACDCVCMCVCVCCGGGNRGFLGFDGRKECIWAREDKMK